MPSTTDLKIYGDEPTWETVYNNDADRQCALIKALNWYNNTSDARDQKKWLIEYMASKQYSKETIDNVNRVPAEQMILTNQDVSGFIYFKTGTIARMVTMGAPLDAKDIESLEISIAHINKRGKKLNETALHPKQNVQKNIDDNFSKILEFLELRCDDTVTSQKTIRNSIKDINTSKNCIEDVSEYIKNIKPMYCKKIIDYYSSTYTEICEVIKGEDDELRQGYSCYSKTNIENYKTLLEKIISVCQNKIDTAPKPIVIRKKRRKPPIEVVKKLKYLKQDAATGLVSVAASKIVDAQKLVVYNSKLRTVTIFEADSSHGLSVKGTTIVGFDDKKSKTKKLRKPKEFFSKINGKGIRAFKNAFDSVKSVEKPAKGRINADVILYGVYE